MIYSNCKINLGLNILKKREDGYHELDMVMMPVDFNDVLKYEDYGEKGDLILEVSDTRIPIDEKNIVRKAYNLYFDNSNTPRQKIKVFLDKKIPHEAGLGGGSSNAAFILRKLNDKYKLYTNEELEKIALKVGADVPFFIRNKSARVTGIGEKIEEIENNLSSEILLIKPQQGMSTGQVYSYYKDNKKDLKMADIMSIVKALKENNLTQLLKNIENSLEQLILKKDSSFRDLKNELEDALAKKIFLSGSGSCFFAFCENGNFDTSKLDKKNVFYQKTNRLVQNYGK